jgi:hypothetical protein
MEAFDDLRPAQWSVLIFNATVNTVAALTGLRHDYFAALAEPSDLGHLVRRVDEGKAGAAPTARAPTRSWEMNVPATQRQCSNRCSRTPTRTGLRST